MQTALFFLLSSVCTKYCPNMLMCRFIRRFDCTTKSFSLLQTTSILFQRGHVTFKQYHLSICELGLTKYYMNQS